MNLEAWKGAITNTIAYKADINQSALSISNVNQTNTEIKAIIKQKKALIPFSPFTQYSHNVLDVLKR